MKFLIAFAVIAVSFAAEEVKVVHLPPAPVPAFETPDYLPFIAPASIFEALKVAMPIEVLRGGDDTPLEEALTVMVRDIPSVDQNEDLKVRVYDGPIDAFFNAPEHVEPVKVAEIPMTNEPELNKEAQGYGSIDDVVDAAFEQLEPVRVAEIPMTNEPELNKDAAIEPVKVAVIGTNEVPIERVKVMDPFSKLPLYDNPLLR